MKIFYRNPHSRPTWDHAIALMGGLDVIKANLMDPDKAHIMVAKIKKCKFVGPSGLDHILGRCNIKVCYVNNE